MITRLLGTVVAARLLRAIASTSTGLALTASAVTPRGVATGIRRTFEHRHFAAPLRTKRRAFDAQRRHGAGSRRSLGSFGSGSVALIREGRGFPALGRVFHFRGRKDVELGLHGGSGGFDDRHDGRDWSGGRSLREFSSNNRDDYRRGNRSWKGYRSGRGFVGRTERILVFGLRLDDLNGGGFVGAADGRVAGGGR